MIYKPKHKTREELLKMCGFTSAVNSRGYEYVIHLSGKHRQIKDIENNHPTIRFTPRQLKQKLNNYASTRLHALLNLDGEIELHLDEPHPQDKTKHKARSYCQSVEDMIKKFKKLDVGEKWYIKLLRFFNN